MSGTGSMTPISVPATDIAYQPLQYTLLPLPDYARIIGINPIQFMSGYAVDYFPNSGSTDRWVQYSWQDDQKVSREDLAVEIARAERDIASIMRYWPAPVWGEDEEVPYPQFYRKDYVAQYGHSIDGTMKSVKLGYGKFIEGGKRAVTLVGQATLAGGSLEFLDIDGDGFNETARVTVATSLTDPCELKVYFSNKEAAKEWEVRPLKSKYISGGYFVALIDAWLLFDPDLLCALPGTSVTGYAGLDAEDSSNYVTQVDVYREYNDPTDQCVMLWQGASACECGGTGCPVCGFATQNGCLVAKSSVDGLVSVVPATYSNGEWTEDSFDQGYEPQKILASYKSGLREVDSRTGCWGMPSDIATAVAYMATARLDMPLCTSSETLKRKQEQLQEDLIFISPGGDATRFVTREVLNCPFGTRYGELEAWRIVRARLKNPSERNVDVAIV